MHTVWPLFESAHVEESEYIFLYWWSTDTVVPEANVSANIYISSMKDLYVSLAAALNQ